ncbi:MAG: flagellar basal body rod protein FlgC [Rhodospirillaceae bacterium]|jgi:flagellar basal-body rod protein FlgC|nr:flagellar basal body rod protein FlgC [Rhodospirillaceae bacterium]MBT4218484.1 flagellar basal body rod protein FlgC [Rhodospirillaceae bacterium]MBT4464473.1 flagellar basal body rod protein FlgC [Rhodospirillaceae bacterium]MBT5014621.1 flagellar basal body rod protein FlgC [Rhodospirillaceae bacterium]MBT5309248.1 flagellar basal body rod protein FlgC [Rhodospirillaceae bacterium]
MDDIMKTLRISSSGMRAQGTRLRVISENIANAGSVPQSPGETPYRRKVVTFKNTLDRTIGLDTVKVDKVLPDRSEFKKKYDPSHPAAGSDGYIQTPNVNSLIEMMDMREAQRSYDANLNVMKTSKTMINNTIDLLR